ncbi:MAG: hypothetical protein SOW10_05445 [Alloprevotella sp.]|nr:hypothetical protein [Alloprevotella sp.]
MNKLYISPTSTAIPVSVSTMLCGSPQSMSGSNGISSGGQTKSGDSYTPRSARESQIGGKEDRW